jgi:linker histone H1 and H5 family
MASQGPYYHMIRSAIIDLRERGGSNPAACKRYIQQRHPDLIFRPQSLRDALKKGVAAGKFIKMRKGKFKLAPQNQQAVAGG